MIADSPVRPTVIDSPPLTQSNERWPDRTGFHLGFRRDFALRERFVGVCSEKVENPCRVRLGGWSALFVPHFFESILADWHTVLIVLARIECTVILAVRATLVITDDMAPQTAGPLVLDAPPVMGSGHVADTAASPRVVSELDDVFLWSVRCLYVVWLSSAVHVDCRVSEGPSVDGGRHNTLTRTTVTPVVTR